MPITERLMKLGTWSIRLTDPTLKDEIDYFQHVVVVPGEIRHPGRLTDASILALARYSGIIRSKRVVGSSDQEELEIGGQGPEGWLGDEDKKGFVFETARAYSADSFANVLDRSGSAPYGLLRDDGGAQTAIHSGVINSIAGTYGGSHHYQDQRTAIRYVCEVFGGEYRVNPDFTLDAGVESDLFVTTPTAIIARKLTDGRDPTIEGIPLAGFEATLDANDYTTRTILLAEGTGETIQTGAADIGAVDYSDPYGNDVVRARIINESETELANATTRAQLHLNRFSGLRKALTISTRDFDIEGSFNVGDTIYVWDPTDDALVDTANEVHYRGQVINPIAIRALGSTWSISEGMSVYIRHSASSYTDVTDRVVFEELGSGPLESKTRRRPTVSRRTSSVEIGANPRSTESPSSEVVAGRVNTNPDGNDLTTPATPAHTNTPWTTGNYQDNEGRTRSQILVEWLQPLNGDASTITDGSHYSVRWRRNGETVYNSTSVPWGTEELLLLDLSPGITYEISVSAVDLNGNASAYSTDESVVALADVTAPSTPAAATVAGNELYVQVEHELGVSGGGTFNLENDLDHLNIYISTTSGFTPGPTNFAGMIEANAGHLSLGIKVIGTFEILDTTLRYVKVTAVDRAGNESPASAQASASAVLISNAHIANLDATKITTGILNADRIGAASIVAAKLNVTTLDAITATMGTLNITSTLTMTTGGIIRTAASGERIEITEAENDRITFYSGLGGETTAGYLEVLPSPFSATYPSLYLHGPNESTTTYIQLNSGTALSEKVLVLAGHDSVQIGGGQTSMGALFLSDDEFSDLDKWAGEFFIKLNSAGTAAAPTYAFYGDQDNGAYRFGADEYGIATSGTLRALFGSYGIKANSGFHVFPRTDDSGQVGSGSLRWNGFWSLDTSINTSDPTMKEHIEALPLDALRFVRELAPIRYKWRGGIPKLSDPPLTPEELESAADDVLFTKAGKRWHYGFSAVDLKKAMDAQSADWGAYIDPSMAGEPGSKATRLGELVPVLWEALRTLADLVLEDA